MNVPSPPQTKPVAFYDTECFQNYWLLKFRVRNGGPLYTISIRDGQSLSAEQTALIYRIFDLFTTVSCNGNYYDVSMVGAALAGYNTEQLKWVNDQIILHEVKPWELNLPEWKPADHIDILEVAPGAGGQKTFAGRIHCKLMRDLPFEHTRYLSSADIVQVDSYCENDLTVLEAIFDALEPQLELRISLSERYGIDLRSKSDAQVAEAVLKHRCERALQRRLYKPEIDWNLHFRYEPPAFLSFQLPQLQHAFQLVTNSVFALGASGAVEMPEHLDGLEITIGNSVYKMGIGGLHSKEKKRSYQTNATHVLKDVDVESYYPNLILNSGKWPKALGSTFLDVYRAMKEERKIAKDLEKQLKKQTGRNTKDRSFIEGYKAYCENEGGKIMLNGTFGKTGSPYSILFAPEMMIQTTLTGQLSLLMLIEWHELNGIPIVSANTDGIVVYCPRTHLEVSKALIAEWERRTGLKMEESEYKALYSRDVNNYFAIKTDGDVKRKGEYSKAGLVEKKNPDVEICADAVAKYLSEGVPLLYTIAACRDIRKFVTVCKVNGGALKLWGETPRKETKVVNMGQRLEAFGWRKVGRQWTQDGVTMYPSRIAYEKCFDAPQEEYVGKIIRFYYSKIAPGPIVYASNRNTVSLSYGGRPCMVLPDTFPDDVDYDWYLAASEKILKEIGLDIAA